MTRPPITLQQDAVHSPIGKIYVVTDETALCAVDFEGYEDRMMKLLQKRYTAVELVDSANPLGVSDQIQAYLAGQLDSLDEIPTETGGTAFQQQVWQQLKRIPPGVVWTYGDLAQSLNNPKAVRAVGMANSLNPISIVLPCHRVVGANRQLTGYAGGLEHKRWLLLHEGVRLTADQNQVERPTGTTSADQLSIFSN
ncbi:MAG: methylated-DNA--[protein]-cysteine S-methyltransferase [Cyanobacteria bacterium J06627_15]